MRVWQALRRWLGRFRARLAGVRLEQALERHRHAVAGLDAAVKEVLRH